MTSEADSHSHTNRLIHETSPYLLQHAHNPVDWHPWGNEALERARKEGRPILLSIGYSACHWCHVMERESFEDEKIALLMNDSFINIKVDREERPDLDAIYMAATVAMNNGQGGWPMTVFLTPELEPLFAGTYFPPSDKYGRPGFATILTEIARAWNERREELRQGAAAFSEQLRQRNRFSPALAVGDDELKLTLQQYAEDFDSTFGGFGAAPKFPPADGLSLLLRLHRRFKDESALTMVRKTLDAMAQGGMYDHIGGGFARYSTDRRWLVPHFEKMLYDNALLARVYLEGYQVTGDAAYARVAGDTLDYVLREMTSPEGGIYSSTDADSEGVEGQFFVWTPEQIAEILDPEEARRFSAYYDITAAGNWEGRSIPNTPRPLEAVADELGIAPDELGKTVELARQKVYHARERRAKPGLDDKVLTAWNGLMISALCDGHRVLGDARYLETAERAAGFILTALVDEDGGLLRTYREGKAHLKAYLEDYAYLSEGLIDLYEAGGSASWLQEVERLLQTTLADFIDEESGAFYNTAHDHEQLLLRHQNGADGATPAANAVAASALARLSYHLDREDLRDAAARAIKAYGQMITRFPRAFAKSLTVVDFLLEGPIELALIGRDGSADLEALKREVAKHYLPNRIQAIYDPSAPNAASALPLLEGKGLVDRKAALYVCRNFACRSPITDPRDVESALQAQPRGETRSATIAVRLPGSATADGTARYAAGYDEQGYRMLGTTGLTTSILGFGGYRTDERTPEHRTALAKALRSGVNLIDTSTNYMDGGSERLVGGVLHDLIARGRLSRDEVIVVSKIGYVQGRNLQIARDRESRGSPYPDMVKYDDSLWHCIHPEFLKDQLQFSLDRLELQTMDICLLHNPEYFLSAAARRGASPEATRNEFYRRLTEAFAYFESQVAEGQLSGYGVSSNTAVSPGSDAEATSLTRMLEAARAAGGAEHHFSVLQLPLNLFEAGALFERNDGPDKGQTVLEVARADNIAVLVNRPLNAFAGGTVVRLADVRVESDNTSLEEQLSRVAELESAFRVRIAPHIEAARGSMEPSDYFRWAEHLRELAPRLHGLEQWSQVEAQIRYALQGSATALDRQLDDETASRWATWRDRYAEELDRLLRAIGRQAAEKSQARSVAVAAAIDPELPAERRDESLSRKALWALASTSGVACVLVGMRTPDYVDDALAVLAWPPIEGAESLYRAVKGATVA